MNSRPAEQLCDLVLREPDIPNATVKIAAWLIAVARATGGFPLTLSIKDFRDGVKCEGDLLPGTGSRPETIKLSLLWLQSRGYLHTESSLIRRGGKPLVCYTLRFDRHG